MSQSREPPYNILQQNTLQQQTQKVPFPLTTVGFQKTDDSNKSPVFLEKSLCPSPVLSPQSPQQPRPGNVPLLRPRRRPWASLRTRPPGCSRSSLRMSKITPSIVNQNVAPAPLHPRILEIGLCIKHDWVTTKFNQEPKQQQLCYSPCYYNKLTKNKKPTCCFLLKPQNTFFPKT